MLNDDMDVMMPEVPKAFSKAAWSPRQELGGSVAPIRGRSAKGGQPQQSPRANYERPQTTSASERKRTANALLIDAEILLNLGSRSAGHGGDTTVDKTRSRELCSSPRLHHGIEKRLEEASLEDRSERFVKSMLCNTEAGEGEGVYMQGENVNSSNSQPHYAAIPPKKPKIEHSLSSFISNTQRFQMKKSKNPPVGHYTIRYNMVDAEPKGTCFGATALVTTPRGSEKGKGQQGGKAEDPKESAPALAISTKEAADVNQKGAPQQKVEKPALPPKPSSAFASRVPQLKSLEALKHIYRTDIEHEHYNEANIAGSQTPRNISMRRQIGRNDSEDKKGGRPQSGTASEVMAMACQVRPFQVKGMMQFEKQVPRQRHFIHGCRFGADDVLSGGEEDQTPRSARLASNDPKRDGSSIDYVDFRTAGTKRHVKGSANFKRQTPRRPLYNVIDFSTVEYVNLQPTNFRHQRDVNFNKMIKQKPAEKFSDCEIEQYPVSYEGVDSYVPVVDFQRVGSHADAQSVFSPTNSRMRGSDKAEATIPKIDLCHPRVAKNINLSKFSPRQDASEKQHHADVDGSSDKKKGKNLATYLLSNRPTSTASNVAMLSWSPKRRGSEDAIQTVCPCPKDSSVFRPRTTGNPMLGKHLTRNQRTAMQEGKPIATSDRDYNVNLFTMKYASEEYKNKKTTMMDFNKICSREEKRGGRLGAEYAVVDTPGPGAYLPTPYDSC